MTSLNKNDKIIYIHIPKCAGSSIERVSWLGGAGHVTYKHLQSKYNMKDYFVFTSIRNPLDRLVSAYFHFVQYPLKTNESENDQNCYRYIKEHYSKFENKKLKGFPEFIMNFPEKFLTTINHFRPQRYFLENSKGNVQLDYVMKLDTLQNDFNIICDKLGKDREELRHAKKSEHLKYLDYYDNDLVDIAMHYYEEDFILYDGFI